MPPAAGSNVVAAFTEHEVCRLTGISVYQLRYWAKTEFFNPCYAENRLYSFRDLVCLQVLNAIRNEAKVSLPHLREVKEKLSHMGDNVWAKTTLYVLNKKVVFDNPETQDREEIVSGQKVLQIPLAVVKGDMIRSVKSLRMRAETSIGQIHRKKGIASSHPVIAGTRIQVASIQAFHEAGHSIKAILKEYPALTVEDVRAALAYAKAA